MRGELNGSAAVRPIEKAAKAEEIEKRLLFSAKDQS